MILDNLYTLLNTDSKGDNSYSFEIKVNKDHEIFKGHFPGNPVMPGVCMIQIIKNLTEETIGKELFMEKCSNVKFITIINPEINDILNLNLVITDEDDEIKVKNITKFDDTVALKLSAFYKAV
jgi:3-hydroxyacyl-[acyl-carrier-protein] dehydratase